MTQDIEQDRQPEATPVGHSGTRVIIQERPAWAISGWLGVLVVAACIGGAILLAHSSVPGLTAVPIVTASGEQVRPGNLGRNVLRAPGMWNLDLSVAKDLAITERIKLQLRGDAFNSLNHTNLGGLVTNITSSSFGYFTSATARSLQVGAKILF